jgi:hypothetical protein
VILSISSKQVKHHYSDGLSDDVEGFISDYLEKTVISSELKGFFK